MEIRKGLTKLDRLLIREMSGVDFGANEADGWLVIKSKDEQDNLLKEAEAVEAAHRSLLAAVDGFGPYLETAPDEVVAAIGTVKQYLTGLLAEETDGEGEAAEQESTDAAKSRLRKWFDGLFRKDDIDINPRDAREALGLEVIDLDPVDLRDALGKAVEAAAGGIAWDADRGLESVRQAVQNALPNAGETDDGEAIEMWVRDIALNVPAGADEGPGTLGGSVLIESYEQGKSCAYVAQFERSDDGAVALSDRSTWVEVQMAWVEKARENELTGEDVNGALGDALSAASQPGV